MWQVAAIWCLYPGFISKINQINSYLHRIDWLLAIYICIQLLLTIVLIVFGLNAIRLLPPPNQITWNLSLIKLCVVITIALPILKWIKVKRAFFFYFGDAIKRKFIFMSWNQWIRSLPILQKLPIHWDDLIINNCSMNDDDDERCTHNASARP